MDFISLNELCKEISISTATGKNWVKLGKLTPEYTKNNTPYFSKKYVQILQAQLQSGENKALKSRRNKKYVSGNSLYNSYVSKQCKNIIPLQKLLVLASDADIDLDTSVIQLFVADCCLHLFITKEGKQTKEYKSLLLQFLNNELSIGEYDCLISDLIEDRESAIRFCEKHPLLFSMEYTYEAKEDILGLVYLSCKNMVNRKATGSYYTPTKVVKKLISKLNFREPQKILDPCCGTGNFLLQLPEDIAFDAVYGNDIDRVSAKIARLNMALKYKAPVKVICRHITELNYLTNFKADDFQYIIGNPPWGYDFSEDEKAELRTLFKSALGRNIESYDVFIEQALNHLTDGGHLAFVLPEAILNVKAHTCIRDIIITQCSIRNLEYLGDSFDGVQCPCVILDLENTHKTLSTQGMNVTIASETFTINTERNVSGEYFNFTSKDVEYYILKKIKSLANVAYLSEGNADFALGIVTGNNKDYISDKKTEENEMIVRGSDICKYHINPTDSYIIFKPENFQQTAPTEIYRAKEKLFYRFISSQLVFAYDDKQRLSLNSCNIVIPKISGLNMKYVLSILNSGIAQFFYRKEFNSVKVLRSHIESIPIPIADTATQEAIVALTEKLISVSEIPDPGKTYDELDALIAKLYNLNSEEFEIIKKANA